MTFHSICLFIFDFLLIRVAFFLFPSDFIIQITWDVRRWTLAWFDFVSFSSKEKGEETPFSFSFYSPSTSFLSASTSSLYFPSFSSALFLFAYFLLRFFFSLLSHILASIIFHLISFLLLFPLVVVLFKCSILVLFIFSWFRYIFLLITINSYSVPCSP